MEDWYEINFNKSKNIAYFSCLRGAIDLMGSYVNSGIFKQGIDLEEQRDICHKNCLIEWEKWYLKEFPRPQDENQRSLSKIKSL